MKDMLELSAHLPEVTLAPGETLLREGESTGSLWILVSGALQVRKGKVLINSITQPGALVGEMSLLLGSGYSATVRASQVTVLRQAVDGRALMASDPAIMWQVAVGLAERLDFVTSYLADLKVQYGDAPGMSMVTQLITQIAERHGSAGEPGPAAQPEA